MSGTPAVRVERLVGGRVGLVLLSRPHRRNAWTGRMHADYRAAMAELDGDPVVRAVVVAGDPDGRAFCVGGDSDALESHRERGEYRDGLRGDEPRPGHGVRPEFDHDLVWHWGLRVPVLCAVNGACAGVGLALACFADLRWGQAGAKFTTAAPKLGLPAEYGMSWVLPRLVGVTRAADWLLSGRAFTAEEAMQAGFLNGVLPEGEVVPAALAYAEVLATEVAPSSLAATKRQLYTDLISNDVGAAVDRSAALLAQMVREPDYAEGVRALRERRPPSF
jgi:enoyl-CoA hydratase/carnithine racemase